MTDSDIIAASGGIVAVASFAVSIAGVWWARKSALCSMKPVLVGSNLHEFSNDRKTYTFEFGIDSVGAGPAILRDTRLYFKGELFPGGMERRNRMAEILTRCLPSGAWPNEGGSYALMKTTLEKHGMPAAKGALRPGDRFVFARLRFDSDVPLPADAMSKIVALLDQADYQVDYTSIYGGQIWTCRP